MLENKYEKRTYTVTGDALISSKRYCDVCEKEITGAYYDVSRIDNKYPFGPVETLDEWDACSVECLKELFGNYIKLTEDERRPNKETEEWAFNVEHHSDARLGKVVESD